MKKSIEELQQELTDIMNGIQSNSYDVWYTTIKRRLNKRKSFATIEEIQKWCKVNKEKVIITSASWQVFEIMRSA